MNKWKKILGVFFILALIGATVSYFFRTDLILWAVKNRDLPPIVTETPEINWQLGPEEAGQPISERPPNIILILADDLGINDISAFGGGVADGLVPTPSIDRIAAEGVNFSQGYAGNATCSPSRAMLMTGRYATSTGFEFTPTPADMGRVVSLIVGDIRPDLPNGDFYSAAAAQRLRMKLRAYQARKSPLLKSWRMRDITTYILVNGTWALTQTLMLLARGFMKVCNSVKDCICQRIVLML